MNSKLKAAIFFRVSARYSLLLIGIVVFLFALVSGSEELGGGLSGIVKNSPNAIPWLALIAFTLIAWKNELVGGSIITISGIALILFFNVFSSNFFLSTLIMTSSIFVFGIFLLLSWYLRKI